MGWGKWDGTEMGRGSSNPVCLSLCQQLPISLLSVFSRLTHCSLVALGTHQAWCPGSAELCR